MKDKDQLINEFIDIMEEKLGFKLFEYQKEILREMLKGDKIVFCPHRYCGRESMYHIFRESYIEMLSRKENEK